MSKEEYLEQLRVKVDELPRSNMGLGGGTHRAATTFVEQMEMLTEPEIRMVIGMRIQVLPPGDFRDWLMTLPV